MRYKITGRNINVTPGLKAAVEEKIGKLERYFNQDTEVNITLTVEKDRQKIELPSLSKAPSSVQSRKATICMYRLIW